ncbi:MAG: tryptophan--tRNA ligase [Gammaproteobacteria bacterium]|jgi:tryptophanyl-tRNA synthetase|nr:tryptophan--tRNA ligase [Gammaproteobacteria bacterium]MBT7603675.1 tryptophan--tRNA ligase [Gammaproteobacteria bacterium]
MSNKNNFVNRVLSGVQPTGGLHLGNYLGAIKNFVPLQEKYESLFCVVDLHAITVWQEPAELISKKCEVAAAFIASGIDPKKSLIFNQSQVPEHSQLAWILNCVARMGWLNRMTQFKDKAGKNKENVSVGLFAYPILMASDIMIYKATHVPVGDDQKQHLELCRDIVLKFNNDFQKEIFPLPEPIILKGAARVMSLRDGLKKMSKSDVSEYSRIMLTDTNDIIAKKIKKAKTDAMPIPNKIKELDGMPEASNLLSIYAACEDQELSIAFKKYQGKNFSDLKSDLTEVLIKTISPIREEMSKLTDDSNYLQEILDSGSQRARIIASEVLKEVYDVTGLSSKV